MKKVVLVSAFLIFSFPLFSQVKDIVHEQAVLYREEGYALQKKGDLESAAVFYQKAIQTDPVYPEAYNDLGVILETMGQKEAAVEMYEKALKHDPGYLPAYSNLAFIYEEKNDTEKATYYWKKRYQLSGQGDYWRYQAMKHLVALGTYPEVKKELLAPQVTQCYKELSYKREQAKQVKCEDAKGYLLRGRGFLLKKDYKGALQSFKSGLALDPPDKALAAEISEEYVRAQKLAANSDIKLYLKQASGDVEREDYKSAVSKLKEALSLIFGIEH